MLIVSLITLIVNLIASDYYAALLVAGILAWVGVAFMAELRCVKLQKQIDELNGNN
jgi:hypothetical protein